jgi:hypothetical protein
MGQHQPLWLRRQTNPIIMVRLRAFFYARAEVPATLAADKSYYYGTTEGGFLCARGSTPSQPGWGYIFEKSGYTSC